MNDQGLPSAADVRRPAGILRFGHSPDPDDAYMFYGFATGAVEVEVDKPDGINVFRVEHLLEDIQTLNERAMGGELELTAISAHAYPYVASQYWIMRCGASLGDGYGPLVVARHACTLDSLRGARIGVPGLLTTGLLALKLFLPEFRPVLLRFDQILAAVRDGRVEAGVIIHEGQLTWERERLHKVADLGARWKEETGLPLPLGLDVVRKNLGRDVAEAASRALRSSIEYARAHHEEAMNYALKFGRGLDPALGERFVGMYVNERTLDLGDEGRRALALLLDRAADAGLVPRLTELKLV